MFTLIQNTSILPTTFFEIEQAQEVSLDIETDGLDPFINKIILLQIRFADKTFIFDVRNLHSGVINIVLSYVKPKLILGHNLKFDLKFLKQYFKFEPTKIYDTFVAEALINNGLRSPYYSLKELVSKYCMTNLEKDVRSDFIDNYNINLNQEHLMYAALDVEYFSQIKEQQVQKLGEQNQLKILELENRLLPVLVEMELNGVNLNIEKWKSIYTKVGEELVSLSKSIKKRMVSDILNTSNLKFKNCLEVVNEICIPAKTKKLQSTLEQLTDTGSISSWLEENINLNSNKQLLMILNKIYKLNVKNTNEKTINKLLDKSDIIKELLIYREKSKEFSTYGEKFLSHIHPITGRIHGEYNQLGAASGRLSSSNPNMQNIKRGSNYRTCFIAPEGHKFLTLDYEQQELRVMASISREPSMTEAFQRGDDIHQLTANKVGVIRDTAKNINFAMGYGSTEFGLYKNFGIPQDLGKQYIDAFFNSYPKIKEFSVAIGDFVAKNLYSSTVLGRKRYFEDRKLFRDYRDESTWFDSIKREGVNHVIQGTSADCTKKALCNMYYNNPFGEDIKLILTVHDEVVVDFINKEGLEIKVKEFCEKAMKDTEAEFLVNIPPAVKGVTDFVWSK